MPTPIDPARRVVVTGLGCVTPLGGNLPSTWTAVAAGRSGCGPITRFDASALPVHCAGEVTDEFDVGEVAPKELRRMDRCMQFALAAAREALTDSGLEIDDGNRARIATLIGTGTGGLETLVTNHDAMVRGGVRRLSPFTIPMGISNMPAGIISIHYGITGPGFAHVSACASGAHAIGEGAWMIASGRVDAVVAGGVEAPLFALPIAGFASMRALSPNDGDPERVSRPFDRGRDGFVVGEGGGVLILESLGSALARGATIHAELLGYGASSDAHHVAAPDDTGNGPTSCMEVALADSGLEPDRVDYVNAHATSTPVGDPIEIRAMRRVFGKHMERLPVSGTKSMTGHLLGAAGAVEAILTIRAIQEDLLPPTINLDNPDPECEADHVANKARVSRTRVALSNSFGFGGTNASLVFGEYEG